MKKLQISLIFLIISCAGLFLLYPEKTTKPLVGIIIPIEHEALNQIVTGIKTELLDQNIRCKVLNAQGDSNIQKAIIEKLVREKCDIFMPIGTATSQMTLSLAKNAKIICLAADPSALPLPKDRQATILDDTLSAQDTLAFLHNAFPSIKKISFVYSSSEKVSGEIPIAEQAAKTLGIEVQKLQVHTMQELYTIGSCISADSGAILIFKDHLVVSGVAALAKQAREKGIFIMTSDEGSVSSGGTFALGVKESSIGIQGGKIAKSVLQGALPSSIAPQTIDGPLFLFINRSSCLKQGIDLPSLILKAKQSGISVEYVDQKKDKHAA